MRITFVLENADLSGGVRVVAIYAQKLYLRGHHVTVISTPNVLLPMHLRFHSLLKGRGWPTPGPLGPSHLDNTNIDHRILPRYRPVTDADVPDADVIVATTWRTGEWVNRLSPRKGAKAHLMQHYEDWAGPGAVEGVQRVWRMPSHKIVISKWLEELAHDRFGIHDSSHVPNSVDLDQFDAPLREKQEWPTVGMLYHDVPFKGIDVSLKAIAAARETLPQLRVIAFGRDEPTSSLPLPAGSTFIRQPAQDKIREVYAGCDVWMCGSRAEGFHLPPLEAMACRTPVVSTRVGGPMDVIEDGVNGYLVDVEDSRGLARRVLDVVKVNEARWKQMSSAARATAERYTWDDATDLFEEAMDKAVAKTRRKAAMSLEVA